MQLNIDAWDVYNNPEYVGRLHGQAFRLLEILRDFHYEYFLSPEFQKHVVFRPPEDKSLKKSYYAACYHAKGDVMVLDERRQFREDFSWAMDWAKRVFQATNRMRYKRLNRDIAQIPVGNGEFTIAIVTREFSREVL